MNIFFKELRLKNFMRYGGKFQTFTFDNRGKFLIIGQTETGQRNGVGKSAILDALSFVLFGRPLRSVKLGEIVNSTNKKDCVVELDLQIGQSSNITLKRGRSPEFVKMIRDNKDETPATVADFNRKVEKMLGMDFQTFKFLIVFSANNMIPFFDLPKEEKRSVADQVTGLSQITEIREKMIENRKEIRQEKKIEQARIDFIEEQNRKAEHLIEQHRQNHARWIEEHQQRVENWEKERQEQLQHLEAQLGETQEQFSRAQETWKKILEQQDQLRKLRAAQKEKSEHFRQNEQRLNEWKQLSDRLHEKKLKLEQDIQKMEQGICPTCGGKFASDEEINKRRSALEKIASEIQDLDEKRKDLLTEVETQGTLLEKINKTIDMIETQLDGSSDKSPDVLEERILQLETKRKDLLSSKNPYEDEKNPYENVELPEIEEIDRNRLNALTTREEDLTFLIKFLDVGGPLRKTIGSRIVSYVNQRIDHFLSILESEFKMQFDGNFEPTIIRGPHKFSYHCLSMGERQRVNLAVTLAFRDVVERSTGSRFNVLFFDEVLDSSLDTQGVEDCIRIVNEFAQRMAVYVISHRLEVKDLFDEIIMIERKGLFSKIVRGVNE